MNTNYKPLPRIVPQNINLLLGSSTGSNIQASFAHAMELLSSNMPGSVLYINTVDNTRSMNTIARGYGLKPNRSGLCEIPSDLCEIDYKHSIYIINLKRGDLHRLRDTIREHLYEGYIQYVIINSWEFAASSSRYREQAIFLLKDLTDGLDEKVNPVSVMVYAEQPPNEPVAQKIQRGGFGKLSGLAKGVESISLDEEQFPDTTSIDELAELPEVKEMQIDPRIGTEDEPGISDEEAYERFLKKVKKELSPEEIEERERRTFEELGIRGESEVGERSEVRGPKSEVEGEKESALLTTNDYELTTSPSMPVINSPVTSIEELRPTPVTISRMPIHQNSYPKMNARERRRMQRHGSGNVHTDIVVK